MSDRHPESRLIHIVRFRLNEPDHARLARHAEALRLRVNECARQLVIEKSRGGVNAVPLDPAAIVRLQAVGVRLREVSCGDCDPALRARLGDLLQRIEQLIDLAVSGEA